MKRLAYTQRHEVLAEICCGSLDRPESLSESDSEDAAEGAAGAHSPPAKQSRV
jgi:hypothetical protein